MATIMMKDIGTSIHAQNGAAVERAETQFRNGSGIANGDPVER
jgi:hypothetical protein